MSQAFVHEPVMVDEVVSLFATVPAGVIVDATVGGGGHSRALLTAHPQLQVVGLDQDADAVQAAREQLAGFGERAEVHKSSFGALAELVQGPVSGVLFDLGVSSPQLDRAERGFTYRAHAPLDMRMDRDQSRTAAEVVNEMPADQLAGLLRENGEGRMARRIANAIAAARPISSTTQLVDVVRAAVPAAVARRGHPAKRVFQALRIEVNRELDVLPVALDAAIDLLAPGGRCVVLSYHSGEDRIVKERFLNASTGGCTCPPGLPCACGATPTVRLLNRGARKPSAAEVAANPRAESARLRAVERLPLEDGAEVTP